MPIELPNLWDGLKNQNVSYEGSRWTIAHLVECAKELEVFDLDIKSFSFANTVSFGNDLLTIAAHVKKVNDADLKYPIILHPEGYILDGRHRMTKALISGKDTIKAVRFGYSNLPAPSSTYDVSD